MLSIVVGGEKINLTKKHISNLQVSKRKKLLVVRILRIVRTIKLVHANDRGV